jgi:hypothetical protein
VQRIWGILFVGGGVRSTLVLRAWRSGSPEISGSRCMAGDAGEEERKGERGRRQVGSAGQREKERESVRRKRATGEKKREQLGRAGLRAGRRKRKNRPGLAGPRGKRGAWLPGLVCSHQTLSYFLF